MWEGLPKAEMSILDLLNEGTGAVIAEEERTDLTGDTGGKIGRGERVR